MALIRLNNQSISSVTALPSGIDTGKIIQHTSVQGNNTPTATSSTSYVATALQHNITPTSASNKVLVMFNFGVETRGAQGGSYYWTKTNARIYRNNTDILVSNRINASAGAQVPAYAYGYQITQPQLTYLDSPNTTSSTNYRLYIDFEELQSTGGFHSAYGYYNITLIELEP
ncbi:hypothetical protein N9M26_01180 [Alphaproteobacteria bacterium]|nr:hypothetical protein [Alphaproteobacteria bacterium]